MLNTFGRRYGRLIVSLHVIEDTETMHELFQHFIPLQVDWSHVMLESNIVYAGYSQDFAETDFEGAITPTYRAFFKVDPKTQKPKFSCFECVTV